jgi:hypothetical protein
MDIRRTSGEAQGLELTRKSRELIESRQPLNEPIDEATQERDPRTAAQSVKEARDAYREQRQIRIANARAHYTANHAKQFLAQVENARNVYEARMEKVEARRYANTHPTASIDSLDLSSAGQGLAELDSLDSEQRADRLAQLRELYQRGQLTNADLIARAAYRMLGGE